MFLNKCPICGEDYTAENKARELKKVEIELKKVEELIRQREKNINSASELKYILSSVEKYKEL